MKINETALQQKINWFPHKNQQRILDGSRGKRMVSICAGVRFGKSALCGYEAFKYLLSDNMRVWIVSLSYEMAQRVMDYVLHFAEMYDRRLLRGYHKKPTPRFDIPEFGSFIECKSIDTPNSLLGEELDLIIGDEASRFEPDIYERYLMARLASRQGKFFTISTPFGKNWFYRNHLKAEASFNFKSIDNPYFPIGEWERAKATLPEHIFKQEYEAQFLDDAASVFRTAKIERITDNSLTQGLAPHMGHFYIIGVDLGKTEDFTAFTIIDRNTYNIVHIEKSNKVDYSLQKQRIVALSKLYNNALVVLDTTGGVASSIKDDLQLSGVSVDDFVFSGKSKRELVEKLALFIEGELIRIPKNPELLEELSTFGYQLTEKTITYSAPKGLHDDLVMSLGLSVWKLNPIRPNTEAYFNIVNKSRPKKQKSFI